jgi:hypothetical protein
MDTRKASLAIGMVVFVLVCLVFVFPAFSFEKKQAAAGRITIYGIVVERETDQKNRVISVSIQTRDQGRYQVINRGKGKKLLKLVDLDVEVDGSISEIDGIKSIAVDSYRVMNN